MLLGFVAVEASNGMLEKTEGRSQAGKRRFRWRVRVGGGKKGSGGRSVIVDE